MNLVRMLRCTRRSVIQLWSLYWKDLMVSLISFSWYYLIGPRIFTGALIRAIACSHCLELSISMPCFKLQVRAIILYNRFRYNDCSRWKDIFGTILFL